MFDGVVDEIGKCIKQEIPISRNKYRSVTDEPEIYILFFCGGVEELDYGFGNLEQIHRAESGSSRGGLDLGNACQ